MISRASELLEKFIQEESSKLAQYDMPHMPTLGEAYEEITKQGVDNAFVIPKFLDLRVVRGFVKMGNDRLPQQIDCMLVVGEGERYGLTEQFYYDIENILCIFEVKKTLQKSDFIDAYDHLGSIRAKFSQYFENKLLGGNFEPKISSARKAFAQLTGKIAPETYNKIHQLSEAHGILFYALVQEENAPISIVHGYGGYKTEEGLRTVFVDMLEDRKKLSGQGLGIPGIPSLVISNSFCLIKANNLPYLAITDNDEWVAVISTRHNPTRIILELIWTKISIWFDVKMPYGVDLDIENASPLLTAIPIEHLGQTGWKYKFDEFKEKKLLRTEIQSWEPFAVSQAEVSAINLMGFRGGYLDLDEELDSYFQKHHGCTLDVVTSNLLRTRMFAKVGFALRPVSSHTLLLTNDDDSGYLSTERHRFDAWCEKNGVSPHYISIVFVDEF
jgi:hypothetical protein